MSELITCTKKSKSKKKEFTDDSVLSKNHSKSVKYRLRVQQQREAEDDIKEFKDGSHESDRPD